MLSPFVYLFKRLVNISGIQLREIVKTSDVRKYITNTRNYVSDFDLKISEMNMQFVKAVKHCISAIICFPSLT